MFHLEVCAAWGGLMSGLTVGLLSIDELELELKAMTGTESEKARVSSIVFYLLTIHFLEI